MRIAVASQGTSLDAWVGIHMASCSQFLLVDSDSLDVVIVSIPSEQVLAGRLSPALIRALVGQGVSVVVTGSLADPCRQALTALGIETVAGAPRMTVREAVEHYAQSGSAGVLSYQPVAEQIAVASDGPDLDARLHSGDEPCSAFVLVDAQTMAYRVVEVTPGDSLEETSVNAVRASARNGATVVITAGIRPACCAALRALGITVVIGQGQMTVRDAVELYRQGKLRTSPY